MHRMDMNSDLGESFGTYVLGDDEAVLRAVSSANVACGFHAGDPQVMETTVNLCARHGVSVGAHPGHPDLQGFGRRTLACTPWEAYTNCLYQIGALRAFCDAAGVPLVHVKPHGALYNQAAKDPALAEAIARAVKDAGKGLILLGLAGSAFDRAAEAVGVPYGAEAFADRGYQADGTLVPRSQPGALIHDPQETAARVVRMATEGKVRSVEGTEIAFRPHSICFHGDTPEAVEMALAARKALAAAGVQVCSLKEVLGL